MPSPGPRRSRARAACATGPPGSGPAPKPSKVSDHPVAGKTRNGAGVGGPDLTLWGLDRSSLDHWHGDQTAAGGSAGAEQHLDGGAAHGLVGQPDGREAGPEVGGEFVVVERDDRDVTWDGQAVVGQRLVGAEGEAVVHAQQGTDVAPASEKGTRHFVTVVRLPLQAGLLGSEPQSPLGHLRADAGDAARDGGGVEEFLLRLRVVSDEGDPLSVTGISEESDR